MYSALQNVWRFTIFRGVIAIVFGLAALFWPGITLQALIILFAAFVFLDGIAAIVSSFRKRRQDKWWLLALEGIIGIAAGIVALIWPALTALVFIFILAGWAFITGFLEILAAIQLRRIISNEWLLALSGISSIIFGLLIVFWPNAGILALVWLIGAYAVIFGALLIYLGNKMRILSRKAEGQLKYGTS